MRATGMISSPFFTESRKVSQILGVVGRDQHLLDAAAQSGEQLLLQDRRSATPYPRSVISPVIATSRLTGIPVSIDTITVAIATPALGPSLGVAPSGTWTWMSRRSKRGGSTP